MENFFCIQHSSRDNILCRRASPAECLHSAARWQLILLRSPNFYVKNMCIMQNTVPTSRKSLSQHLMQLEARVTNNMLQTNVPLSKPAAVCVASDDLLLCADDGHRVVYQIQLERNWITINGKLRKLIAYPEGIHHLESIAKSDSSVALRCGKTSPL